VKVNPLVVTVVLTGFPLLTTESNVMVVARLEAATTNPPTTAANMFRREKRFMIYLLFFSQRLTSLYGKQKYCQRNKSFTNPAKPLKYQRFNSFHGCHPARLVFNKVVLL
jgi:hypothetical protein